MISGRNRFLMIVCALISLVLLAPAVASADPTFGVMNASGGIYWRSGPDWNTAEATAGNGFTPAPSSRSTATSPGRRTSPAQATACGSKPAGQRAGQRQRLDQRALHQRRLRDQPTLTRRRALQPATAAPSAPSATAAPSAPPPLSSGQFTVMNASGGIYWRSAPDWNTPEAVAGNGFYPNTVIAVSCYQAGAADVPGSTDGMWDKQAGSAAKDPATAGSTSTSSTTAPPTTSHPPASDPAQTPPRHRPPTPDQTRARGSLAAGQFPVANASGGVYWRSGPDWNTAEATPGVGFYPGTIIAASCYQAGAANVPGSTDGMWEQASWVSGQGSGHGWINEHFINDGSANNQPSPGIGPCSNPTPPPTTNPGPNPGPQAGNKMSKYTYCTTVPPMTAPQDGLPPSDWLPITTGIKAKLCMTAVDTYDGASAETRSIQSPVCPSKGWFKAGSSLSCGRTTTAKARSGASTVDSATVNLTWTNTTGLSVLVFDYETEDFTLTVRTAADGKHTTSSKVTNVHGWQTTEGDIPSWG